MEEPIRVFSDLHLGHPGCRLNSPGQLAPLFAGAATVVFNGDSAEQRHPLLAERGERLLGELKEVVAAAGARAVFLRGNHDPRVSELDHLDLAGGRVFLTHGDALFRHLSPWSPKVWPVIPRMEEIRAEYGEDRLASDLAACLECVHRCRALAEGNELEFKTGRFRAARTLARMAWPPLRPARILGVWLSIPGHAHAFAARYRPGAKVILFGHSHFAGIWRRQERLAVNTGGFLSVMPARGVEIQGGGLAVRRIEERRGELAWGPVLERASL